MNNLFGKLSKWIKMKIANEPGKDEKGANEYKILVLGEKGVGKSSFCTRFAMNEFNLEIKPTLQAECYSKTLKLFENTIKLYIVDIDENVMSNDRSFLYQDVKGAIVLYDITKSKSFEKVDNWILDVRQNSSHNIPIVIVGNKSDLNFLRNVDHEEGVEKSNTLACEFIEASCVDTTSVKEAFKLLVGKIYYSDLPESKKNYFKIYFSSNMNNHNSTDSTNNTNSNINNLLNNDDIEDKLNSELFENKNN